MPLFDLPSAKPDKSVPRSTLIICLLLVFNLYSFPSVSPPASRDSIEHFLVRGKITKVIDGDSIEFKQIKQTNFSRSMKITETLRLVGIDAYEMTDPKKKYRMLAHIQKDVAYHYLAGREVLLELEKLPNGQPKRDIYKRLLGYVILEDRKIYQELSLQKGFVRGLYTYPFKREYEILFQAAERRGQNCPEGIKNFPPNPQTDRWEELVGEIASIRFRVRQVRISGKYIYLEVPQKNLSITIPKWATTNFSAYESKKDFRRLENKWITVSGFVTKKRGKPAIRVYFPGQIEVD